MLLLRKILVLSSFVACQVASFTNPNIGKTMSFHGGKHSTARHLVQNPSAMIDDVLRGNSTAASSLVNILNDARGTESMEQYLVDMLPPELNKFPLWTRLPLSKYSRRARQLRLRRLIELSNPSPENYSDDDDESKQRRSRRALFILLRNIADNPDNFKGISKLLAEVKKDAADVVIMSPSELLKRTPDLETPKYKVLKTGTNGVEIRQYDQFSVCSVTMKDLNSQTGSDKESASKLSNPQLSGATSFGALAGYLFGKNQDEKAMKMTTPVLTEGDGDSKKMSFVLPSDYWDSENLSQVPKPLSDSAVKIVPVEGSVRAVLAFGGYGGKYDAMSTKLKTLLAKDKEWSVVEGASVALAQYNDPFTPPWKRRNEVSILVVPRHQINVTTGN